MVTYSPKIRLSCVVRTRPDSATLGSEINGIVGSILTEKKALTSDQAHSVPLQAGRFAILS